ncbi:MAG TPA: hypothetical protein VF457_14685, partial [Burkholderiaceae bacterium]
GAGGIAASRSHSSERGAAGHEEVVHRVDGLRVTPHWTHGDTVTMDVALTRSVPGGLDGADVRRLDVSSTVELGFDEWQTIATAGDDGRALQLRVRWR